MKELKTLVGRQRIVPVFFGNFEAVKAAGDAAITNRVWSRFKRWLVALLHP
jgi:hypothetical protein